MHDERYNKLRNRCTNNIRRGKVKPTGKRILRAKREDELWKMKNEVKNKIKHDLDTQGRQHRYH